MRSAYSRRKVGIATVRISIILVCISLLVSCASTTSLSPESPFTTPTPETPQAQNGSIPGIAATGSSAPSASATLSLLASPQGTAKIMDQPASTPQPEALTHYSLDAVFDYYQHSLAVTESIRYVNNASEALTTLVLVVESNRWPGSFSLLSMAWEGGAVVENYLLNEDRLELSLPSALHPGDELAMEIKYALDLPQIPPPSDTDRPQPYGYTARQTNIVDWYPYIPPYRSGEGWLVHKHWWFGEHQVYEVVDYDVRLEMADVVPDLVLAASAPAEMDGDAYVYHLDSARTFALSASNAYVRYTTHAGDVEINSYVFPFDNGAGEEVLHNTADALELFSQLIMPYPHLSLSVVEADFLDGMEYDGLFFLSHGFYDLYDGTPRGYLTFIAAHETAHQWWFGLVGNDQALEPWLDEAMCTYMEHIFYENVYAEYPADSGQPVLDWWWYYRVNFYEPSGWVDGSIYEFNQFRPYRDSIYLNGAKFFEDLRNLIGDEAFFAFLKDYARQEQYQVAISADFFTILRENTDQDLGALLEKYFQTAR